ncbi:MAG: tRNA pseudouridine(13) synthase TruD [Promethearchaeota archaeon]|nr:MAG: tRNA pseudouridine(13) synthase TruD [Candidatus Lokiarchaeota archaeon]
MINERDIESLVGIKVYSTSEIDGVGGIYKHSYKDFIVKEIISEGEILGIKEDFSSSSYIESQNDNYTTLNLIKINKDTFEALREISRTLNIPFNSIHYCGLKDKCSISVQKISIAGNQIEKLKKLRIRDSFFRSVKATKKPVKIGGHWGNHFTITIRNIDDKEVLIEDTSRLFKALKKRGFPNYFGLQRFGIYRPNSHLIGRYLLEGKFKEAYHEFVIKTYPSESETLQSIRNKLKDDGDLEEAYKLFPETLFYERKMIYHLMNNPNDYEGCFNKLHDDLNSLLISAFQSYIFNKMISLRIKKGFLLRTPVKGDVISILEDDNGSTTRVKYTFGAKGGLLDNHLINAINLNRASIILPIVGYDTNFDEFPLMKDVFNEVLEEEHIDSSLFESKLLQENDFKGSIRPIIIKPIGLKLLMLADDDSFPGKKKLKFEFSLPKGCYATMLLRELMK